MLNTQSKTPRKPWSRLRKSQRTKERERSISTHTQPAHEPLYFNHSSPIVAPTRDEALCRAMRLADLKCDGLRAAASHVFNTQRIRSIDAECRRLSEQASALSHVALWGDATPQQEITALAACAEHYPQGAKIAGAASLWKQAGNTFTFHVLSSQVPHAPYWVTFNKATDIAFCNCKSSKECWHIRATRHVVGLYALCEVPADTPVLISIEKAFCLLSFTDVTRLNALLDTVGDFALQGACECYETRRWLDNKLHEAKQLVGGDAR